MKKIILLVAFLFSTATFAKVTTAVSILPQVTFLKAIGGDKVSVTLMVEPGNSPHTYEPKPSLMRSVSKADVYFSIGVEFEDAWLEKIFNQNENLLHVKLSKDIKRISIQDHNHHGHDPHEIKDENKDPHIWTSPKNVGLMAETIYITLSKLDPENSTYYKKNYLHFLEEIETLDKDIKALLKDKENGRFMVFHPSWGYFAKEYNLEQIAIEEGGKNPKPKHIISIIQEIQEKNIKAIITAPEFPESIATQIADESGAKVVAISPLAKNWSENLKLLAKTIANK